MAINPQSITDFKQNYNPAPTNRFHAYVTRGKILDKNLDRTMTLRCESADLPGRGFATSNQQLYGPIRRIPYNSTYIDATLVFQLSDNFLEEKRYFDQWQDAMQNPNSFDVAYYDDLIGTVKVESMNEKNDVIYSCTLLEAYPLTITGVTLNWANRDEAMKLSVTMAYRKWERQFEGTELEDIRIQNILEARESGANIGF